MTRLTPHPTTIKQDGWISVLASLAAQTLPYSHLGGRGGSGEMAYPILFRATEKQRTNQINFCNHYIINHMTVMRVT